MYANRLIGGTLERGDQARVVDDPGDGATMAEVAWSGAAGAGRCACAASKAFDSGSNTARTQAGTLRDAAAVLADRCDGIAPPLVREGIADDFDGRLAGPFVGLSIGHGVPENEEPVTDLVPMIDRRRAAVDTGLVEDPSAPSSGAYMTPALVANFPREAALSKEEIIGPAAGVFSFRTDEEALAFTNSTDMGPAYAWTDCSAPAWMCGEQLETGIVGSNDPLPTVAFAPICRAKPSGLKRENSPIRVEEFREIYYRAWRS